MGTSSWPPVPVEALLFDLGGVILEIDFPSAFRHWARCAGVAEDDLRARFSLDEPLGRYECGQIDASEYYASLRQSLGVDLSDAQFHEGWASVFAGEVAGIRPLLESVAHRAPIYGFSNTNHHHQEIWSSRFAEVLRPFRRIFTSCELGKRKPTPQAFHAVSQAIDVPPENILFFDDLPENVEGAKAVGMQAVLVRSIHDIEDAIQHCHWSTRTEICYEAK